MITRIFQSSCWWNSSCQCTSILGLALFFWILLYQLLLHQDFFLVLHLAVLRDLGVAVELQLVVTVLRLPWLVVGVLVGVVVGQGYFAELSFIIRWGWGGGGITRQTWPELLWRSG